MTDGSDVDHAPLHRVIGVSGVAFTAFNCVVGAGIFGLPALVAALLGPAAIAAYIVCIVLIGLVGLCFAEAGSRVSDSGGLYAYARAAYGPVASGVAGMLVLIANSIASGAALARFTAESVALVWPAMGGDMARTLLLGGAYLLLALINIHGARDGARLTAFMAYVKLAPLVLLVIVGAFAIRPANLAWPAIPAPVLVGQAAVILFFAFMGVETGLGTSGETVDTARTIPRAILLALSLIASLYIGLQLVAQGVLGTALADAKTPLIDTATAVMGPWGTRLFLITTIFSGAGYMVADMLSSPRTAFALAEARQLPRWFATVHPRHGTPTVAIAGYALVSFILAATGSFRELVILASSGTLALYLMSCLSILPMRKKGIAQAGTPFRAPGGAIVPLLASAIIIWLLGTLAWSELFATMALIIVSALIYGGIEWRRARAT